MPGDFIEEQVELLLAADDSDLVPFFTERKAVRRDGFADEATALLVETEDDEHMLLQLVLAAMRGDYELAGRIAGKHFEPMLRALATDMVEQAIERENERGHAA